MSHFQSTLLAPLLLTPCERIVVGGLRCVLMPEARPANTDIPENTMNLLPADGALYLTNYRIVFKGRPTNPFRELPNSFVGQLLKSRLL